jgi:hypothetical protein
MLWEYRVLWLHHAIRSIMAQNDCPEEETANWETKNEQELKRQRVKVYIIHTIFWGCFASDSIQEGGIVTDLYSYLKQPKLKWTEIYATKKLRNGLRKCVQWSLLMGNKRSITPPISHFTVMRVFPDYHTGRRSRGGVY